jgi:hypothetical protein
MTAQTAPVFARRLDDAVAGLCGVWMICGLFLDGWAHRNQKPETFFSPWHGLLYSGFLASAIWMLRTVRAHRLPGVGWRESIPVGYGLRSIGVAVFGVGAFGDLIWHQIFGIEADIEALLSPTHLVLLSGGLLMAAGPIVSTLQREGARTQATWASAGPVVGTVAFVLSLIQFFFMYASPYDYGKYDSDYEEALGRSRWLANEVLTDGIVSAVLFALFVAVAVNFVVKQVQPPRGAFVVLLLLPAVLQTVLNSFNTAPRLIGPALAAVLAELTWGRVRKSRHRAAVLPGWIAALSLVTTYGILAGVAMQDRITWSVHLWTGLPFLCALMTGLLSVALADRSTTRF